MEVHYYKPHIVNLILIHVIVEPKPTKLSLWNFGIVRSNESQMLLKMQNSSLSLFIRKSKVRQYLLPCYTNSFLIILQKNLYLHLVILKLSSWLSLFTKMDNESFSNIQRFV